MCGTFYTTVADCFERIGDGKTSCAYKTLIAYDETALADGRNQIPNYAFSSDNGSTESRNAHEASDASNELNEFDVSYSLMMEPFEQAMRDQNS